MAKVFISYKQGATPDEPIARFLVDYLKTRGHDPFIDKDIPVGQHWPAAIQTALDTADFLVVLLSPNSIASDMVIKEVSDAYKRYKATGAPTILPVRLAFKDPLPYDLGARLDRVEYAIWQANGDETTIAQTLHAVMSTGHALPEQPLTITANSVGGLTTDGNFASSKLLAPPLPAFDPNWLDQLEAPGGAIRLASPFYVERDTDKEAKQKTLKMGVTLRVKGGRQTGKTSLLARLYQHCRDNARKTVRVDFQRMDQSYFADIDAVLRYLADAIALVVSPNRMPEKYWQSPLGAKDKLTQFIQDEVLVNGSPIVLLLDEVDRVFAHESYRDDFFALIRAWHNERAFNPAWDNFNIVLSYSTDAHLFITDMNQSPFNVGDDIEMADYNRAQLEDLNIRHGSPLRSAQDMDAIMKLLGGHPFLTRKALYDLVTHGQSVKQWHQTVADDDGPFQDHLHRYLWRFQMEAGLYDGMRAVIDHGICPSDVGFYRLRSVGLIRGSSRTQCVPRCELYTLYFGKRL
jgi:hypothetical protein